MAKSLGSKKKSAKSARRAKSGGKSSMPGLGDNRIPKKKDVEDIYRRLDDLHNEKETNAAEYMADIKAVLEEGSNKLGVSRKVLREEYIERRHQQKRTARINALDVNEAEALERLEAAFGNEETPFGRYVHGMNEDRRTKAANAADEEIAKEGDKAGIED